MDESDAFGRAESAAYIAELAGELASVARAARCELLAYFLTLARMEAESIYQEHRSHFPD